MLAKRFWFPFDNDSSDSSDSSESEESEEKTTKILIAEKNRES